MPHEDQRALCTLSPSFPWMARNHGARLACLLVAGMMREQEAAEAKGLPYAHPMTPDAIAAQVLAMVAEAGEPLRRHGFGDDWLRLVDAFEGAFCEEAQQWLEDWANRDRLPGSVEPDGWCPFCTIHHAEGEPHRCGWCRETHGPDVDCKSRDVYVNTYRVQQCRGGSEEGGWFYDAGEPMESRRTSRRLSLRVSVEASAEFALDRPRYGRTSAASSEGDVVVMVEGEFAAHWPRRKPQYE